MTKFLHSCLLLFVLTSCASASSSNNKIEMNPQSQCVEGTTRQGFLTPTTNGNFPCTTGMQTCVANFWQGPQLFDSCDNYTKNCDNSPHGTTINGFMSPTAFSGTPCIPASKTCLNGQWNGPEVYPACNQVP
ncbi:MAG: hypothetical protein H7177_02510 [Rhizobacter sp.]|nr:hypothetical protein [Bacteriovorax sp.]